MRPLIHYALPALSGRDETSQLQAQRQTTIEEKTAVVLRKCIIILKTSDQYSQWTLGEAYP